MILIKRLILVLLLILCCGCSRARMNDQFVFRDSLGLCNSLIVRPVNLSKYNKPEDVSEQWLVNLTEQLTDDTVSSLRVKKVCKAVGKSDSKTEGFVLETYLLGIQGSTHGININNSTVKLHIPLGVEAWPGIRISGRVIDTSTGEEVATFRHTEEAYSLSDALSVFTWRITEFVDSLM